MNTTTLRPTIDRTSWLTPRHQTTPVVKVACIASLMIAAWTPAQTPSGSPSNEGPKERIHVDVFTPPSMVKAVLPDCFGTGGSTTRFAPPEACQELRGGIEGWAVVSFMIDSKGKPYEAAVISSTGNRAFDDAAIEAMERSTFLPALLNGKPIEAARQIKVSFFNTATVREGAGSKFVLTYEALMAAIDASDRAKAESEVKALKITNLYEDAYFGLATYQFAKKWGDERQQLEGLNQAIAAESHARYLPVDTFRAALLECMKLQLKARQYAEALLTWKLLATTGLDKTIAAQIRPILEQVERIRSDDTAYAVAGLMPAGPWHLRLFKRHFQISIKDGSISQVRLRCDRGYVAFPFDPAMQYQVADNKGDCEIELNGAAGTHFDLVQS